MKTDVANSGEVSPVWRSGARRKVRSREGGGEGGVPNTNVVAWLINKKLVSLFICNCLLALQELRTRLSRTKLLVVEKSTYVRTLHNNAQLPDFLLVSLSPLFNPSLSADKLLEGRLHEFELPMMPVSKSTAPAGSSVSPVGNLFVLFYSRSFFLYCVQVFSSCDLF
jgi:hypothetical protein